MIFYFLIFIVFIAEIIIAAAIITNIVMADKFVLKYNDFLTELQPKIKDLLNLCRKISEQFLLLAPAIVNKVKSAIYDFAISQLKNILAGIIFWSVKNEVEKRIN